MLGGVSNAGSRHPALVYADHRGNIVDHPRLAAAGSSAGGWHLPQADDWIPLPQGSELFLLPERLPVGCDPASGQFRVVERDPYSPRARGRPCAVAALVAPAHTQLYSAAYRSLPGARTLPRFAYTAVGWQEDRFVAAALRVDPDPRQDPERFDTAELERRAAAALQAMPDNRLVQHLGRCALSYGCPAAKNYFLGRWEAPLPTSPACNARCLGCISLQDAGEICATQERIRFVPSPEEIAGVAVPHLRQAPRAVVSFGQGCEGEPLLQGETLEQGIRLMRRATARGTINLNSNASLPEGVARLRGAGLDSMRGSRNSCRPDYYRRYYSPRGYCLEDVLRSIRLMKREGGFVSLNYFVLPGLTDEEPELEALSELVAATGVDLIQLRNLNIDPEWYLNHIRYRPAGSPLGVRGLLSRLRERFPSLAFGYFNPCLDPGA